MTELVFVPKELGYKLGAWKETGKDEGNEKSDKYKKGCWI